MVIRHQFIGLARLTEYNASEAARVKGSHAETACAINTLLAAHAAFEALVLETALDTQPATFAKPRFREASLAGKYRQFLEAAGRNDQTPPIIGIVAHYRAAITHTVNQTTPALGRSVLS